MVKFNLRKMFAVGLLSATAAFAGVAAMHGAPSVVAYAADDDAGDEKKETAEAEYDGGIKLTNIKVSGNYIYVSYYADTDKDCKKAKSTAVYLKSEAGSSIVLGDLSLKKGGYIKVYSEVESADDVKAIEIAPQAAKVKVKVVNLAKEDFFDAVDVLVNGNKVKAEDWAKHGIFIDGMNITGETKEDVTASANAAWEKLKIKARLGGITVYVSYRGEIDATTKKLPVGLPSEAKVKIKAAPKEPKVTIDYVSGGYKLPKGSWYMVVPVDKGVAQDLSEMKDEEGKAIKPTEADPKKVLSISDILDKAEQAAIIAWIEKDKSMNSMRSVTVVTKPASLKEGTIKDNTMKVTFKADEKATEIDVAELTFTAAGVKIKPLADLAYWDGKDWVTMKKGKSSKKDEDVTLKTGDKLKIKSLGDKKAGTFGSYETEIDYTYTAPKTEDDKKEEEKEEEKE